MKILLISDLHSRNAYRFVKQKKEQEGIERLVCLGDYDDPEIVEYLRDTERELGMKTTILPGNHDFALASGEIVFSPNLSDPIAYKRLWELEEITRHFILNAPTTLEETHQDKKFFFSHAEFPDESTEEVYKNELWHRMPFDSGRTGCFAKMQNQGVFTLFRGHDHDYGLFSIPKDASPDKEEIEHHYLSKVLDKQRIYIANIGPFFQGEYGIFDTESFLMRFGVDG